MTPHKLTIRIALIMAFICTVTLLCYQYFNKQLDLPFTSLFFLLVLIANYSLTRFLLERFIYRKLKPIYKLIKGSGKTGMAKITGEQFNSDIMEKLDEDVNNWASSTEEEIASLKSLEKYRKDYIGNISHELKTPIFSIQGYIHTLLEGVGNKKQERRFLKRAAANTDRLVSIVNDLELIANLEDGIKSLNFEKFDIHQLVEEVFLDLDLQVSEIKFEADLKN